MKVGSRLDVPLIVKVAKMYYLDGLKQEDIARQIGISRSLISIILSEAKETGIVEITVHDPFLNDEEMSRSFAKFFPGLECIVVPTSTKDAEALRKLVAQRAADIVAHVIRTDQVVGLAWGRTCWEIVNAYRDNAKKTAISVVPLIGGSLQTTPYFQINEMVRLFAEKLGGTPSFIHAPALVSDVAERNMYFKASSMQLSRELWGKMDLVISGIGALPKPGESDRASYIGESEIFGHVGKRKVVGDICARYFCSDGGILNDEFYKRIVGVPVDDLRAAKRTVFAVSGIEKADAVAGALRTGLVKTLVLDEPTAKATLSVLARTA